LLDTTTRKLLSACWKSASRAVGGACGTVGSLARALALDEAVVAEGVVALIGLGYLGRDRHGVVWVTAAGADIV